MTLERRQRALLPAHDFRGGVGLLLELRARRQERRQRLLRIEPRIERQRSDPGTASAGWLTHHIRRSRANQAVAAPEMVLEKRDRLLGGQRCEPERELRELDGHRVGVDAEQAALRDEAPEVGAIRLCDLVLAERPLADQRAFQRAGQKATGRDQERTAAHRGIQHAQRKDGGGVASLNERLLTAEREQALTTEAARDAERTRIAREMHDAVGHRVSLMVLQAGAIEMAATDRERVEQLACQVQVAGRQALDELRQAVGVLRDGDDDGAPLGPQPGLDDIERMVKECRAAGMDVEMTRPVDAASVDPMVCRAAYRIAQEALTNAGKHAPGAHVSVAIERPAGRLVVRVVNGPATEPVHAGSSGGYGLVGLRERVRTLNGTLRAEPRLDGGFVVEAVLPA